MAKQLVGWIRHNGVYQKSNIYLSKELFRRYGGVISAQGKQFSLANGIFVPTDVGATFNRGDFTATNAFFWSSIDLSAPAGTDLGFTPFRLRVLDGAGKLATGYLAAVGAGETLGADLLSGWDFTVGWTATGVAAIVDANTFHCSGVGTGGVYKSGITTVNCLYKIVAGGVQTGSVKFRDVAQVVTYLENFGTGYGVTISNTGVYIIHTGVIENIDITELVLTRVTDPPSTAVHIVSSLNGTTRAWENIEAGFSPNTIASWEISKAT